LQAASSCLFNSVFLCSLLFSPPWFCSYSFHVAASCLVIMELCDVEQEL
jgi:hypothetical protein